MLAQEVKGLWKQTAVVTKALSDCMKRVLITTKDAVEAINEIDQNTSVAMTAVQSKVAANDEFAQAG